MSGADIDTEETSVMTTATAKTASAKDAARDIIERLPEEATWDDIHYELYVRQKIEAGLADVAAGRVTPHEEIKAQLLDRKRRAS